MDAVPVEPGRRSCDFNGNADALTAFFGTFNFALGAVSFLLQLLLLGPALRRFGLALDDPGPAARRSGSAAR